MASTVQCEFCGEHGCHWTRHEQAWVDVHNAEQAQRAASNE